MSPSGAGRQTGVPAPADAFAHVEGQVVEMAAAFGLEVQAASFRAAYRAICRRSFDCAVGGTAGSSRLNEDGAPIQFATTVGLRSAPCRFVGDPGPLDGDGALRMSCARAAMEETARIIGVEAELAGVSHILDDLAPPEDAALRDDPAGAFWIGAAFAPAAAPRLRVYVNGRWGRLASRWARVRRFAAHLGGSAAWSGIEACLPPALEVLGMAFTLSPGRPLRGAVYLRAFGLRLPDYAALARAAAGGANADAISAFGAALLGAEATHPTPSAVFSFGLGPGPRLSAELEFCAHCLFRDDDEARVHVEGLCAAAGLDATPYRILAQVLARTASRRSPPRVHAFIGIDPKPGTTAYSIYMKPDLSAGPDDELPPH